MQRRTLLLIISAILVLVGVGGVIVYAASTPAGTPAAAQPPRIASPIVSKAPATAAPKARPLGLAIPPGLMAVSVSMNTIGSVAGYVQKNSQIAVFDTYPTLDKDTSPSGLKTVQTKTDDWATTLLVASARVLAVTPRAGTGPAQSDPNVRMITVAVSQIEAERLIHAAQTGRLYFALLTTGSKVSPDPGIDNQGRLGRLFPGGSTGVTP
jgi:Flp pilus assembly protein CpaB